MHVFLLQWTWYLKHIQFVMLYEYNMIFKCVIILHIAHIHNNPDVYRELCGTVARSACFPRLTEEENPWFTAKQIVSETTPIAAPTTLTGLLLHWTQPNTSDHDAYDNWWTSVTVGHATPTRGKVVGGRGKLIVGTDVVINKPWAGGWASIVLPQLCSSAVRAALLVYYRALGIVCGHVELSVTDTCCPNVVCLPARS